MAGLQIRRGGSVHFTWRRLHWQSMCIAWHTGRSVSTFVEQSAHSCHLMSLHAASSTTTEARRAGSVTAVQSLQLRSAAARGATANAVLTCFCMPTLFGPRQRQPRRAWRWFTFGQCWGVWLQMTDRIICQRSWAHLKGAMCGARLKAVQRMGQVVLA